MTTILILPGWQNSGPEHWQSLWLKKYPNAIKVEQKDWMYPKKEEWVAGLNTAVAQMDGEVVLVAHSLGCPTIAHWVQKHPESTAKIKSALLVAPGDADMPNFPKEITDFSPLPMVGLPFKSILVSSDDDKWVSLERAKELAKAWGSEFHLCPGKGHINTTAGFGEWPEGEEFLARLL